LRKTTGSRASASLSGAAEGAQEFPRVCLVYSYLPFDRACEQWHNTKIEDAWIEELRTKLGSFQDIWDREAPALLGTTVAEMGKPFQHKEMIATLTLCPIPSMSVPLLLQVRRFLDGPTQGNPQASCLFPALVFHELLHTYLGYYAQLKSDLVQKYGQEPLFVLTHLHLMAVMKHVYLKLGREGELEQIVARDSAIDDKSYARAWQIVNEIEGHAAFVREIRPRN
jgi:hypothetical protein